MEGIGLKRRAERTEGTEKKGHLVPMPPLLPQEYFNQRQYSLNLAGPDETKMKADYLLDFGINFLLETTGVDCWGREPRSPASGQLDVDGDCLRIRAAPPLADVLQP